jgi:hypothetical protein
MADTEAADKGSAAAKHRFTELRRIWIPEVQADAMPSAGEAAEYKSGSDTDSAKPIVITSYRPKKRQNRGRYRQLQ